MEEKQYNSYEEFVKDLYKGDYKGSDDKAYEIVEDEYGVSHFPEDIKSSMRYSAYEQGHAYGLSEVINIYTDILPVFKRVFEAGKEAATK